MRDSFQRIVSDLIDAEIGETFNFLRDEEEGLEVAGGAALRRANLLHYLESRAGAAILGLGEAAGYAGARWSGIAFTSERTLASWGEPYAPSSLRPGGWTEQSATIVHRVLEDLEVEEHTLLWNTVPTHPRLADDPLTNRSPPTSAEIEAGVKYARRLRKLVRPKVVVPIGGVAGAIGDTVPRLRHPARGGAAKFEGGMRRIVEELRRSGELPPARNGRASLCA